MRLSRVAKPFDDPDYVFELKRRLPGARLHRRLRVQACLPQPESVPIVRVPEGIAREDVGTERYYRRRSRLPRCTGRQSIQ
jgi:hypothetical protein